MDRWIVLPCHNNSALLLNGLESLLAQTVSVRIFAINNGSKDNVPFVLNGLGKEHIVINAYPQLGVAGAWNTGLRYLFDVEGAEKVLVVNQDIVLRPETYEVLLNQKADFVTAVSVNTISQLKEARPSYANPRLHPDFSCFMISKYCYRKVGPFDESYFPAYGEDCDYHVRMHRKGIEAYCIDIPFLHYGAATIKEAKGTEEGFLIENGAENNRQRFYKTYGKHIGIPEEYERLFQSSTFGIEA